jgi:acetyl-CoA C-acetyltransferase
MQSVIVGACRTPIGAFQGALSALRAPELGAVAVREAIARAGIDPGAVDEVILGNVLSAGLGQAPARQASLKAGVPDSVGAFLVNKVCGSGLKAIMLADQAIRAGDGSIFVAGGMESMSNAPYLLQKARHGYRMGHGELLDSMLLDGLWDPMNDYHMGLTGELCASEEGVTRTMQDEWSARSYERALAAQSAGWFEGEVAPVEIGGRKPVTVSQDECPRPTPIETLAGMRPVFQGDGTVTAGNASKIADGAAAVVVMSERAAADHGATPLARIAAQATFAREPERLMMAPEGAIRLCLERAGWRTADLFEINEPFAAATVALANALELDPESVNVHGGAVALGHPIGATGCRLVVTLLSALERRGLDRGVAALCLGGGEAVALAVERPDGSRREVRRGSFAEVAGRNRGTGDDGGRHRASVSRREPARDRVRS